MKQEVVEKLKQAEDLAGKLSEADGPVAAQCVAYIVLLIVGAILEQTEHNARVRKGAEL